MELQQLRYLLAVSRTLNFSKAAEEMFISQPTLSMQIKKLESELGIQLLERTTRSVEITKIGLQCVELAERMIDAADKMVSLAQEENRINSRRLNVGLLAVYPQSDLSSILAEFAHMHLQQKVNYYFSWSVDLMERLMNKKTDIIITNLDEEALTENEINNWDIHVFLRDQMYVIASDAHPLAKCPSVLLKDAIEYPLFLAGNKSSASIFFQKAVKEAGLSISYCNECPSITSAFNFVAAGQGITVLSKHVAQSYIKPGMVLIPLRPVIGTSTAIVTRKQNLANPLVRDFRDYFLEHVESTGLA